MSRTPSFDRFFARKLGRRHVLALGGSAGAAAFLAACSSSPKGTNSESATATNAAAQSSTAAASPPVAASATAVATVAGRPAGWAEGSHGKDATPAFARVFPAAKVNTLDISVPKETWEAMLANATSILGARGTAGQGATGGAGFGGGQPPQGGAGGGGGAGGPGNFASTNPDWFPATIAFEGKTWTNVGLRFKGNSSLMSSWRSGSDKIPFKLDFDEFEGDHPEIADQRFWGFKQLSLSNNFGDLTGMRETVAYDLFESVGLAAANTAAYEVVLDRGEGKQSLGLYTVIEVIDDTVVDRVFKDATGNIYEADGRAASFAAGTEGQIAASFEVEGGDDADHKDVLALYTAVHAANRTTDAAAWRKGLESVFNMDVFLEWLAIATTIQHWDTYGAMTHNYYLYNDPSTKKLTWISWDHNFVLGASAGGALGGGGGVQVPVGGAQPPAGGQVAGGFGGRGGPGNRNTSFDKKEVTADWPLLRYVMDQQVYYDKYKGFLKKTAESTFSPDKLAATYQSTAAVIRARVPAGEQAAYDAAVATLTETTRARHTALTDFLKTA
ncbi:MAG: CotH kinase family protein [Dehalococcoidia bacterium]